MRLQILAIVITLAAIAGCATQKPSGRVEGVTEARATITAIDLPQGLVVLMDERGREIVVEVSDHVRRLNEVEVGDEVVVSYTEAVAWQVKSASKAAPGVSTQANVSKAKADENPGESMGRTVAFTATITGIDLVNATATLTGPTGRSETFKARDPANLRKVQVGDLVDIVYSKAVAVALQPAPRI